MKTAIIALFIAAPAAAAATTPNDTLLQAVGFALTGSDNAAPQIVDRNNCVFRIGKEIFHLNNVMVDRISFQPKSWVTVSPILGPKKHLTLTIDLHGASTIYETDQDADFPPEMAPEMAAELKKRMTPEQYAQETSPHHITSNEHTLTLETNEVDRVQRAWKYIYEHGCTGQKSGF